MLVALNFDHPKSNCYSLFLSDENLGLRHKYRFFCSFVKFCRGLLHVIWTREMVCAFARSVLQQVAELQKENFGLKLRIYFLENRSKIPLGDNEQNISEMVRVDQLST